MFWRIDRVGARQQLEKVLVVAQPPRAVQEDERRAIAENRDLGLDLVLPESQATHRHRRHGELSLVLDFRMRRRPLPRPRDAFAASFPATSGLPIRRPT